MDPVVVAGYLLIAAAVILLLLILGGFVWMGWELMQSEDADRHAPIAEPPTLDVQNHLGDALGPVVGVWIPLDGEMTPDEIAEDSPHLLHADTTYARNVALPSGRSWRFEDMPQRIADVRQGRFG